MKSKTIICHFYNEEYLLPWWLNHHKKIFSEGLMINYGSTDNSIKIIKEICPNWKIVDTENQYFGAIEIDREIEKYEKFIDGYRIVLNVTEFLIGNISTLDKIDTDILIPMASMVDLPNEEGSYPDQNIPLTVQRTNGINPWKLQSGSRIMHKNNNIVYPVGRHYWNTVNTNDFVILRYKHSPWNESFIKRKMQIASKQPSYDLLRGLGTHHQFNRSELEAEKNSFRSQSENLSNIITEFEYYGSI